MAALRQLEAKEKKSARGAWTARIRKNKPLLATLVN
jgi:hypothetical protein